jgi:DNA-binding transcriptional MerR regulator
MYTTTDITKHLGIKRERLKIWMTNGYIRPSETASGPGTKNLFTVTDLYLLKLFTSLVERGFPREEAALRIKMIQATLHPGKINDIWLIGFIREDEKGHAPGYPEMIYTNSISEFVNESETFLKMFFDYGCDDFLIFNFKKIRESVDKSLGK